MCKVCTHHPNTNNLQTNGLKFTIDINQNYQCICQPCSKNTQIQTSDVVSGLLKYNSSLTKYLAKYQTVPYEGNYQKQQKVQKGEDNQKVKNPQQYKSIVQLYNLKVLPPGSHLPGPQAKAQREAKKVSLQKISFQTQTSPRNEPKNQIKAKKTKSIPGSNEDKIEKHMKQLAASSRYLPNSGFKKYFGRQCFQNYGRQNTTGVADGIVYNNYLKTFNINPHCGNNIPITQQSYRQALITASPKNYPNKKIPETHHNSKADRQNAQGFLKKQISNMEQIIQESQNHEKQQQKYTIKLNKKNTNQNGYTPNELKHVKQAIKVLQQRQKQQNLHLVDPFKRNTSKPRIQSNDRNIEHQIRLNRKTIQQQQNITKQINQYEPIQKQQIYQQKYIPNPINVKKNQYEDRNDRKQPATSNRSLRKNQIIEQCYKNRQVAHTIESSIKPKCQLCINRRFSRCCCVA